VSAVDFRDYARHAVELGISVVAPREDGSKRPVGQWEEFQRRLPTVDEIDALYANGRTGFGFVCGAVSGGAPDLSLLLIEVEGRAVDAGLPDRIDHALDATGLGDWWQAAVAGYCSRSGGGGLHVVVRTTEAIRNMKLASRPPTAAELTANPDEKVLVLIETRGDGGYVIDYPSHGRVHDSGNPYELVYGSLDEIVTVPAEVVHRILDVLRSFDEMPAPPRPAPRSNRTDPFLSDLDRPGDEFDLDGSQVLVDAGFVHHHDSADGSHYTRPGKEKRKGSSATVWADDGTTTLFSTSIDALAEATTGHRKLSPWQLHVHLNHRGDFSTAARQWRHEHPRRVVVREWTGPPPGVDPATREIISTADTGASLPAVLPDTFWQARPVLEHIRRAAHARSRSADAVLHTVLARVAACTEYGVELPPIVGGPASLNYFAAVIGPSGSGKSTSISTGRDLIPEPTAQVIDMVDDRPLGSGEGIAELYMGHQTDDEGKTVRGQVRQNAFVYVDEGEALIGMIDRKGATILETLRRAWSGQTLGQSNASQDRNRVIPARRYRLGLVIGFQPEKAGRLLADDTGGTPQRFMFTSAIDPTVPDEPPDWPGPIELAIPDDIAHTIDHGVVQPYRMKVADPIQREIRAADLTRVRGETTAQPLDSHAMLHKLKIAGLLAILDRRGHITTDDWHLAGIAWSTSVRVRTWVADQVTAEAARTGRPASNATPAASSPPKPHANQPPASSNASPHASPASSTTDRPDPRMAGPPGI
jgi:hypothetical protein